MKRLINTLNVITLLASVACVGCELYEKVTGETVASKVKEKVGR